MSKKAIITLRAGNSDHKIVVNLLDNAYVDFLISNNTAATGWTEKLVSIPSRMPHNIDEINFLWQSILKCYAEFLDIINHADLLLPPAVFDMTNSYTNSLHRIFTTYSWHNTYFGIEVPYTQRGRDVVEEMNTLIHELEKYIENPTRNSFADVEWTDIQAEHGAHNRYFFSEEELENVSTDHSVYCVKHILGKDHLIAYLDEDSPAHWDVQTSWISYYGFCIDFKGDIRKAWKNPEFVQWLDGNQAGYYPVGDISDEHLSLLSDIEERYMNKIEVVSVEYEC